jgi:hypothetical protein
MPPSVGDIGVVIGQIGVLGDAQDRELQRRRRGDVHRHVQPQNKPDPAAQWDEIEGQWEVWDAEAGAWKAVPPEPDDTAG